MYKGNEYQDNHIESTGRREDSIGLTVSGDTPTASRRNSKTQG